MLLTFEDLKHGTQIFAAISAMLTNYLLIKLILNHSPKTIGEYKYLMLFIAIFEIGYAIMVLIVQPIFHSFGPTFMLIVNTTESSIVKELWKISLTIYCSFFGSSMAIFSVHYMYRYWIVSGNTKKLQWFKGRKVFFWLFSPLMSGFIWAANAYFFCGPRKSSVDFLRESVKENLGLDIDQIVFIASYFYEKNEMGQDVIYWPPFIGIALDSMSIDVSLVISIYFGIKCWRKIHKIISSSTSSPSNQHFENQLFFALVAQTVIPIFLMHIPALTIFMLSFFKINSGPLSGILSMTIALFPFLDPIPTILIIPNYRNAIRNYINCRRKKLKKAIGCWKPKKSSVHPYNPPT